MPKAKFLTPAQKRLLKGLGKWGEYWNVIQSRTGISEKARNVHLSHIFAKFLQALEVIAENPGAFASRLKIHEDRIKKLERLRRRNLNEYKKTMGIKP